MTDTESRREILIKMPAPVSDDDDDESMPASPVGDLGRRTTVAPSNIQLTPRKSLKGTQFMLRDFEDELAGFDLKERRDWFMSPLPVKAYIHCSIQREKTGLTKLQRKFVFKTDEGSFLAVANRVGGIRKRPYWSVTLEQSDNEVHGKNYAGKLRWNVLGNEFTAYGEGDNKKNSPRNAPRAVTPPPAASEKIPRKPEGGGAAVSSAIGGKETLAPTAVDDDGVREELALIQYNVADKDGKTTSGGPRSLHVSIPSVNSAGERTVCRPMHESDQGLRDLAKAKKNAGVMKFINRPANWNKETKTFSLNFNDRVKASSVKNFQLISNDGDDDDTATYLQFGRVSDNYFSCDFGHPLSPFQAFCIALSSVDYKLCTV